VPLYEVLLRGGYDESRITDYPLSVGETITMLKVRKTITMLNREWLVIREEPARDGVVTRYICVPVRRKRPQPISPIRPTTSRESPAKRCTPLLMRVWRLLGWPSRHFAGVFTSLLVASCGRSRSVREPERPAVGRAQFARLPARSLPLLTLQRGCPDGFSLAPPRHDRGRAEPRLPRRESRFRALQANTTPPTPDAHLRTWSSYPRHRTARFPLGVADRLRRSPCRQGSTASFGFCRQVDRSFSGAAQGARALPSAGVRAGPAADQ